MFLNLVFVSQIVFSRKTIGSRKMEEKCFLNLSIKIFSKSFPIPRKREDRFFHLNLVFVSQIVFSKKVIESRKMEEKCFLSHSLPVLNKLSSSINIVFQYQYCLPVLNKLSSSVK